tara:strand:- start:830 stop:1438 length:609 start_codon:yes stop_codon:yes gene_type:complete
MGNRQSLTIDDQIFNMKFTVRQLIKLSKKNEKESNKEKSNITLAIQKGNYAGARTYASNVIRKKNESLHNLQLSSRLDGMASKLQTISTQRNITKSIAYISRDIGIAMTNMNTMMIAQCMDQFDNQLQELDIQSDVITSLMDNTNSMLTPEDDIDNLIAMVADENKLVLDEQFPQINNKKIDIKNTDIEDDLMKRLDAINSM